MEVQGGLLGKGSNGYDYGETARNGEEKASQADAKVI